MKAAVGRAVEEKAAGNAVVVDVADVVNVENVVSMAELVLVAVHNGPVDLGVGNCSTGSVGADMRFG